MSTKPAGTVFARRFVIASLAGQGGMGEVYRAHDIRSGDLVALKLLSASSAAESERFLRESQVLAALRHPGIVRHIESGQSEAGEPYLAMEWLDGEDLATCLAREPLTLRLSLRMLTAVAAALSVAHQHDIIHRDIKPSNLFLREGSPERPVVLDFGIARHRGAPTPLTRTGAVLGTPAYMAPEQARGQRDLTPAVDVFALGCVLYECIAGRPAFSGEHLHAVLAQILFQEPPAIDRPDLPPAVAALLHRMLAKDPLKRPQHAGGLRDELAALSECVPDDPRTQVVVRPGAAADDAVRTAAPDGDGDGESDVGPDQTSPQLPLVGRDSELAMLEQAFSACVDEQRAGVLLVTAPPGVGKSRLRHEFLRRLRESGQPFLLLQGRCDRLGMGTPYSVLAQALRRLCGVQLGEASTQRRAKLRRQIERALPTDEAERVTAFIAELCGASLPDAQDPRLRAAHQSPALMVEQITASFIDYLQAECERQPVLWVLEDAHWIDAQSTRILDQALRALRDQPLWVLGLARPELDDRLPGLWAERAVLRIRLPGLSKRASEKLVQHALKQAQCADTPALVARIVEQADGNALFLEELVRAAASGQSAVVPESVLAILDARIEAQPPAVRHILQAASVFGDAFWPAGLRAVVGESTPASVLHDWLALCVEKELVVQRRKGRYHGEPEYRFRHALMRDAAYARLDAASRSHAHRQAGDWLERMHESDALVLAEHFLLGEAPLRAAVWLVRATADALEANDLRSVLDRGERAIAAGAQDVLLGRVRRLQATAAFWLSDYAKARAYASEALAQLRQGSVEWYLALGEAMAACGRLADLAGGEALFATAQRAQPDRDAHAAQLICLSRGAFPLIQQGRLDRVGPVMQSLDAQLESLGDCDALATAQVCQVQAEYAHHREQAERAAQLLERACAAFAKAGDRRSALSEGSSLAATYVELGCIEEAEALCRRSITLSERWVTPRAAAFARFVLCYALVYRPAQAAEQRRLAQALIAEYHAAASVRMEGISHLLLAIAALHSGDLAEAVAVAETAVGLLAAYPGMQSWALAMQARALLQLGQVDEALPVARKGFQLLIGCEGGERGQGWPPLVLLECLLARGEQAEAQAVAQQAVERLLRRAERIHDPQLRQKFLRLLPHERTLALAAPLVPVPPALRS